MFVSLASWWPHTACLWEMCAIVSTGACMCLVFVCVCADGDCSMMRKCCGSVVRVWYGIVAGSVWLWMDVIGVIVLLIGRWCWRGPVAQWITRLTTDQKIPGSNPGRVGNIFFAFSSAIPSSHQHVHASPIFARAMQSANQLASTLTPIICTIHM